MESSYEKNKNTPQMFFFFLQSLGYSQTVYLARPRFDFYFKPFFFFFLKISKFLSDDNTVLNERALCIFFSYTLAPKHTQIKTIMLF